MLSVDYIDAIRFAELEAVRGYLPSGSKILEIGAGSGRQALELSRLGFDVSAIEIGSSDYVEHRMFPMSDYDGRRIPFPDDSFDVVYSSNVLEHVAHLPLMYEEIRRVLRPGGHCIHVLPTHAWRFWTSVAAVPGAAKTIAKSGSRNKVLAGLRRSASAALRRHGERGNVISEIRLFHPSWWRRSFYSHGFDILDDRPVGYFYTAEQVLGEAWSLSRRKEIARWLGSATHIFHLRARQ